MKDFCFFFSLLTEFWSDDIVQAIHGVENVRANGGGVLILLLQLFPVYQRLLNLVVKGHQALSDPMQKRIKEKKNFVVVSYQ